MITLNNQINAAREATKTHTSDVETIKLGDFGFLGVVARVDIVAMYARADGTLLRAAVAAGAQGTVIQALGWGNVNIPLYEVAKDAIDRGIVVVISTRVPNGRVLPVYGAVGGGKTLKEAGAVFADNLSPRKTRILLILSNAFDGSAI